MTTNINLVDPLTLTREMVRVVFPVEQTPFDAPTDPEVSALPDLVSRWNYASDPGTPVTVTYAFSSEAPGYTFDYVDDAGTYAAFTAEEETSVENVLDAYEAVCGITFERV
ncbi:MAG: hypothetical protein HYY48_04845 [Gammaproteobacteria bacterium]|nr:hypothetical protein [Gammaproteobacteria bacterium]